MKTRPGRCRCIPLHWAALLLLLGSLVPGVTQAGGLTPTNTWVDVYSTASTFYDQPVPAGAVIAVFDPQGVQCGEFTVTKPGWYGLMPCYGDDPHTAPDEGAVGGDALTFSINGLDATTEAITMNGAPVSPDTVVTWPQHGILWEVNLHVVATLRVSISQADAVLSLSWQHQLPAITAYEVWRSTEPHKPPGQPGALLQDSLAPGGVMSWSDPDTAGDPVTHYYYHVRGVNAAGQPVTTSQEVARFTFSFTPP